MNVELEDHPLPPDTWGEAPQTMLAQAPECPDTSPLAPASAIESGPDGTVTEVELRALRAGGPMRGIPGRALEGALPCE